jgi:hypothetical protein
MHQPHKCIHYERFNILKSYISIYISNGNISINKPLAKEVENGQIVQMSPQIGFEGQMYPLFTPIFPISCSVRGNLGKTE